MLFLTIISERVLQMLTSSDFQFSNFEEISELVYRLGYALTKSKVDADDVYQDVFFSYFNSGKVFESKDHQKAWFIVVTKNACKKLWRNPLYRFKVQELDPNLAYESTSDYSDLYRALNTLDFNQRTIIHLYYFEGYSLEEISKIQKVAYATLRKQMSRAKTKLKSIYISQEKNDEEN